jgi:hypothetical protein
MAPWYADKRACPSPPSSRIGTDEGDWIVAGWQAQKLRWVIETHVVLNQISRWIGRMKESTAREQGHQVHVSIEAKPGTQHPRPCAPNQKIQ